MRNSFLALALALLALTACTVGDNNNDGMLDSELAADKNNILLRRLIEEQQITADPAKNLSLFSIDDPIAQLGKRLFFSRTLSGNKDVACASCHHPKLMGADGLSLPVGVGAVDSSILGPGRSHNPAAKVYDVKANGSPNVARHSPSTFNVALYREALFWDGRIRRSHAGIITPESLVLGQVDGSAQSSLLATQSLFPLTSTEEMKGHQFNVGKSNSFVRASIVQRLIDQSSEVFSWVEAFRSAYQLGSSAIASEVVTLTRLATALSAYQESQLFINNAWNRYVDGDEDAINASAKKGALLFYSSQQEGGYGCVSCHSGGHFSDEKFHVSAFPQLGRGKGVMQSDTGRFLATKKDADLYAYRTPSLLNVALTGPYGHAGAFASLSDLLKYHVNPSMQAGLYDYSLEQLPQFSGSGFSYVYSKRNTELALLAYERQLGSTQSNSQSLDGENEYNLLEFLKTLSDECLASVSEQDDSCIQPWLLENNTVAEQLNTEFSSFALAPAGWINDSLVDDVPGYTEVVTESPAIVEQCVYKHAVAPGSFSFSEVGMSSGLGAHVPLFDFSSLRTTEISGLAVVDAWNTVEFSGMSISGDINADGYPDLVLSKGGGEGPRVMLNDKSSGYVDVTSAWGLGEWTGDYLIGGGLADLDGDGNTDLVLSGRKLGLDGIFENAGFIRVYRQVNGKWEIVSNAINVTRPIYSIAFTDYNVDGRIDVLAASWSTFQGVKEEYLWENMGGMSFSGKGVESGIVKNMPSADFTFSMISADFTGNAYPDLVATSDFGNSIGFFNNGVREYTPSTVERRANVFTEENGMGAAAADYDNDGDIDLFVSSIFKPADDILAYPGTGNRFYVNDGEGRLEEKSETAGVRDGGWGWGVCAADFDNDGFLDVFHTNGYGAALAEIDVVNNESFVYFLGDTSKLFLSNGDGTFVEQAIELGINDSGQGRGVSCVDYDRDGDVDILVAQNYGRTMLYKNNLDGAKGSLQIELEDSQSLNVKAIGAKISLTSDSPSLTELQYREVNMGSNHLSQSPTLQHFGLGDNVSKYNLEVIWPRPNLGKTIIKDIQGSQCLKIKRE